MTDLGPAEALRDALRSAFDSVVEAYKSEIRRVLDGRPAQTSTAHEAMNPYRVLGCDPQAPREVIEAAYRALAKVHHPDHGGDLEAMGQVNRAMREVRAQRGWK